MVSSEHRVAAASVNTGDGATSARSAEAAACEQRAAAQQVKACGGGSICEYRKVRGRCKLYEEASAPVGNTMEGSRVEEGEDVEADDKGVESAVDGEGTRGQTGAIEDSNGQFSSELEEATSWQKRTIEEIYS